jgi:2-hydroxy-6-oxonona-2,4-dienedioate hydrolase
MGDTDEYRSAERGLWGRFGLEPQERFIQAGPDRTSVRVVEVGEGPPAVFIGGTGGTGPYWAPLLASLGVRAVIVDRPGFGLSEPVDYGRHALGDVAPRVLDDVLDAVELGEATMVGASIGNVWALLAAERLADRVSNVVLLGGGPLTHEIQPPPFIRLLRSPLGAVIVRIPQRPKMLRGQLRQLGHGPSLDADRFPDEFIEWSLSLTRDTRSMRHERAMVRAVLQNGAFVPDLLFDGDRAAFVKAPVLMVFGSNDPTGSVDLWTRFTGALPDGRLRVVEDAGHLPWWDDPAAVARWINEHIA